MCEELYWDNFMFVLSIWYDCIHLIHHILLIGGELNNHSIPHEITCLSQGLWRQDCKRRRLVHSATRGWSRFSPVCCAYSCRRCPSQLLHKLRKLATYIVNIYFPLHMNIKYRSSVIYGALNLFLEISLIKAHVKCKSDKDIFFNTLQTNSYFSHPHNVLIAMLDDECFLTRKEAIDWIVGIRSSEIEC